MRIETVDPRDDAAFADWMAVTTEADQHDRPGEPGWSADEQRAKALAALRPDPESHLPMLLARDGDRAVGAARVQLFLRDNQHVGELLVAVRPDSRRRGVGTALLSEAEQIAKDAGRTTVVAMVDEPPQPDAPVPGRAFAERAGYANAQTEIRRDLDLPLDQARAAALEAACAPHAAGYLLRTWRDRCPDDLLEPRADLARRMSLDVPLGELDFREEEWDGARVRRREELLRAQRRTWFAAGAVHEATGRLAAFSEIGVPVAVPERAYQWETLVLQEHRGKRLGTLVKLACLRAVEAGSPASRYVSTWNAEENAPMIAVNDALGARTNGALSLWQRTIA